MLRHLSNKEMKEKGCYWNCMVYRHGEGASDNYCSLKNKKIVQKRKRKINNNL